MVASCRDPASADELNALKTQSNAQNLHIIQLDVTDEQSIKAAANSTSAILGDKGLDFLINNAGIVSLVTWRLYDFVANGFEWKLLTRRLMLVESRGRWRVRLRG